MSQALVKISWLNPEGEVRELFVSERYSLEVKEMVDFYAGNRNVKLSPMAEQTKVKR